MRYEFKNDKFKKNRGEYSRLLLLNCEKCRKELLVYQKDGPGILKRLYFDRIIIPEKLRGKKTLECKNCKTLLGVRTIYQKEDRPIFRLFAGAIEKKVIRANELSKIKL